MADNVELSPEEIQQVITYWRNRAANLEDRVLLLELALNRANSEETQPDTEEE